MNPSTLIVWCALGFIAWVLWDAIVGASWRWLRYIRTRNIAPAIGQRWMQDGVILTIGKRRAAPNWFDVHIERPWAGIVSWPESDEQWRRRVRSHRLYLMRDDE